MALSAQPIDNTKYGVFGLRNKKIILYFKLFFSRFLTLFRPFLAFPDFPGWETVYI